MSNIPFYPGCGDMNRLYLLDLGPLDLASRGIGAPTDNVAEEMLGALPREKRERLLRFRHAADRKIGLCSAVLLRCIVSQSLGITFGEVDIRTGPAGKPYVGGTSELHFNISHTRCAVAAVLSGAPVGVDIERLRDIDLNIAPSVLSNNELSCLAGRPEDRAGAFCEMWTKKEARLKRLGDGLAGDLRACDVTASVPGEEITTLRFGAYVVSVSAEAKFGEDSIIRITEAELESMWRRCAG